MIIKMVQNQRSARRNKNKTRTKQTKKTNIIDSKNTNW